ncbi:uncharacterized protein SPAPADRAFT_73009 [Spathaspora passalidarum NRRL Y-27907]|uniref:Glycoside hydrolase family 5 domain-containing protein n=1 Tax=Spathaspora passalidarum (strain NRRL Y-27907 / 11-Y1) TaxID=619300 RepID=G3ASU6_SPAPN|nr:uncharacterized protein SPAPADRAFT_73009 [Spathaspora passalidarum NRRL Y-27907]EGW31159.1 hypothetical protein SPAPADRAFT_73009 [Spathaspora passalidarum NRRL Y-27907]
MSFVKTARDTISDYIGICSSSSTISLQSLRKNQTSILECTNLAGDHEGNIVEEATHRKVTLKGINVDGAMKFPTSPDLPSHKGCANESDNIFFDGDNVSFVGRPFPISEAREYFQRIKSWGYNTIRYLLTWEAIEHKGPGIYDEDFVDYTIEMLEIIGEIGGLYVFLEIHQDVWSRFSGGSGAPMWTLYAAGLQPKRFTATEAAIFHNESRFRDSTDTYHKMLWTSNYNRLASLVMFTMFFAGKDYFPNLIINDLNIQDYLQQHYLNAVQHVWSAVAKKLPQLISNGTILGFESMNEPNYGLVGHPKLDEIPRHQQLRVGTTPTAYQTMKLGMGFACELDSYRISITGPQKYGTKIINPKGQKAWLTPEEAAELDLHYGFKRATTWKIGECVFAQQGVWKWPERINTDLTEQQWLVESSKCEMRNPYFFQELNSRHKLSKAEHKYIDMEYFINHYFMDHYRSFKETIRSITPDSFVLIQPPTLQIPPRVKNDPIIDSKTIYCPHYYDGLSLMFKSWNVKYNVDTFGIMRSRYINPILGVVLGERAIRNCIKKQFMQIRLECNECLGHIPILMSETGMPFDMDNKQSYITKRFKSQTCALDAICNALEGANMSHTFWCYTSVNCHEYGDLWNNEDFSFWSADDSPNHTTNTSGSRLNSADDKSNDASIIVRSRSNSIINAARFASTKMSRASSRISAEEISNSDKADEVPSSASSIISTISETCLSKKHYYAFDGVRAPNAIIRPYVVATPGIVNSCEFDSKQPKFVVQLRTQNSDKPTVIFVPKWHFPYLSFRDICLSSGKIKYNQALEYIEWYHEEGGTEETIIIKRST